MTTSILKQQWVQTEFWGSCNLCNALGKYLIFIGDTDCIVNTAGVCCLPSRWKGMLKSSRQLAKYKDVIFFTCNFIDLPPPIHRAPWRTVASGQDHWHYWEMKSSEYVLSCIQRKEKGNGIWQNRQLQNSGHPVRVNTDFCENFISVSRCVSVCWAPL